MNALELSYWPALEKPHGRRARYYPHGVERVMRAAASMPHDGRGWSPATFATDHRKKEKCEQLFAIGFDFDRDGNPNSVRDALDRYAGFVHTTKKHTATAPRCRAIVWTSRPISPLEHADLYRHIASVLPTELAAGLDQGTRDPSRLWFLPSRDADGCEGIVLELVGEPIDVDEVLERIAIQAQPIGTAIGSAQSDVLPRQTSSSSLLLKRATRYIDACDPAISGSGGHATTWSVLRGLAGWLAKGLSQSDAAEFVRRWNARCQPSWTQAEIDRHWARAQDADSIPEHEDRSLPIDSRVAPNRESVPSRPSKQRSFQRTDLGNAERIVAQHEKDLRFAPGIGWLVWNGQRWEPDASGEVTRRMKKTARSIYAEAAHAKDEQEAKQVAAWAAKSESRDKIAAAVALATTESALVVKASELDAAPMLFNATNGTIDLRTGQLRGHSRTDLMTKLAGCSYDPNAPTTLWTAFLNRMLPDPEVQSFLQRWCGYCLTASAVEHALLFCYGSGRNGKGVFLLTLRKMLGDYAVKAPRGLLMAKRNEAHPTELMGLRGARMAWCSEVDETAIWDEAKLKDLASEDPISARLMRENHVEFLPTHKLTIAGNYKPRVGGTDEGIWRRLRIVPFSVTIPETEKDSHLATKLERELPGILAWAVRGCLAWQQDGLGLPAAVAEATSGYREEQDVVGRFLAERCVVADARDADRVRVGATTLYQAFVVWCEEQGERGVLNQRRFGEQLARRCIDKKSTNSGIIYLALGLKVNLVNHGEPTSGINRAVGYS